MLDMSRLNRQHSLLGNSRPSSRRDSPQPQNRQQQSHPLKQSYTQHCPRLDRCQSTREEPRMTPQWGIRVHSIQIARLAQSASRRVRRSRSRGTARALGLSTSCRPLQWYTFGPKGSGKLSSSRGHQGVARARGCFWLMPCRLAQHSSLLAAFSNRWLDDGTLPVARSARLASSSPKTSRRPRLLPPHRSSPRTDRSARS